MNVIYHLVTPRNEYDKMFLKHYLYLCNGLPGTLWACGLGFFPPQEFSWVWI